MYQYTNSKACKYLCLCDMTYFIVSAHTPPQPQPRLYSPGAQEIYSAEKVQKV